jgi:flagellar M-ring protein FliF
MQRIEQLVRTAVGFNAERGDQVSVVNVRFPTADTAGGTEAANPLMGFDKNDIMRGVELLVLAIVGVLMIFFVARPLLGAGGKGGKGGVPAIAGDPQVTRIVVTPDGQQMQIAADGSITRLALPGPDNGATMDIARVDGQVRANTVKKVSDFVSANPNESVALLRTWLHEST